MKHLLRLAPGGRTSFWLAALALLALLLAGRAARAQAPSWQDAFNGGGPAIGTGGTSVARATAVDGSGNVYVTGSFTGQMAFGSTVLASAGGNDVFVAKWDATARAWAWAQAGGGTSTDIGYGVAVDGSGNVYVTGYVTNAATSTTNQTSGATYRVQFGGTGLPSASTNINANFDVFVASYSATGAYRWAQAGGGIGTDYGYGVAVDGSGNVYLTGSVQNAATSATNQTSNASSRVQFGGTGLPSASTNTLVNSDVFVASYSAAGTYNWARAGGGTSNDVGYGVALDGSGNVYLTGYVTNAATSATNQTSSPTYRVQFGGTGLPSASTSTTTTTSTTLDVFVASYTTAGTYNWARAGGGTSNDVGYGVAVDGSGNVYVTGYVTNAATSATNQTSNAGSRVQFGGTGLPSASTNINANNDVFVASYSATGAYRWAQSGGGTGTDIGYGVAVDGSGNVYLTGSVQNAATSATNQTSNASSRVQFGGTSLPSASTSTSTNLDVFVASYSATGAYRWAQAGGGTGTDYGYGVAVTGSTVAVATATGTTGGLFGSLAAPASAAVLAQLATGDGAWLRADAPLQGSTSVAQATAVDGSGNVYVTGSFTGQMTFGSTVLISAGGNDVFVAKWDATARAWVWAQAGGGTSTDIGYGVAVDGSGNVYVTGHVTNAATSATDQTSNATYRVQFGGTGLPSASTDTFVSSDVFVASYSAAGTYRWAQAGGGTSNDYGYGLAVDGSGNVYVTGYVANAATSATDQTSSPTYRVQFGGTGLPSASTNTFVNSDVFVTSYTTAGAYRWAQAGGGTGSDMGYGVALDGSGNVYVTGHVTNAATSATDQTSGANYRVQFGGTGLPSASTNINDNNDVFVASYSATGAYRWAQSGGGTGTDIGYGVAVDGSGNVYVTGHVTNAATSATDLTSSATSRVQFGGTGLPSASTSTTANADVFVASYTTAGTYNWAQAGGGANADRGYGVAVDGSGNVYLTGSVTNAATSATDQTSSATSRVQFGGTGLPSASTNTFANSDVFVASYSAAGTYRWAQAGGGTGTDQGYGLAVAVDGSGTVSVTGEARPVATFGSQSVATPVDSKSLFVARLAPPALTLTSVSPAAELPGQVVTLTGAGFTAASTVSFGGTAAAVSYVSGTTLTATVPAGLGAGSAPISVTAGGTPTAEQPFAVLAVYDGGTVGDCTAAVPATASTGDGQWHYLLSTAGQVVAAYSYSGASLGTLALDVLRADPAQPVRNDGQGRRYLDRNWHLTASAGRFDGRTVALRLYGLNTEQARLQTADATATMSNLKATQYSGPSEDCDLANNDPTGERRLLAAPAASPAGTSYFVAELSVADHFSEFYLGGSPSPLPVRLTSFTATAGASGTVRLAWATASEVNSQAFEVERSLDGVSFTKLGTLSAAGISSTPRTYAFTDAALPTGASLVYYRLRQVDQDGTAHYSVVRPVALLGASAGLSLYPNPAHGAATLAGAVPGTTVTVLDALGRPVAKATANTQGTATLTLPQGLAAGVYVVRAGTKALRLTVE